MRVVALQFEECLGIRLTLLILLQVDSLLSWKTKMETEKKNKAAVVIQKHW